MSDTCMRDAKRHHFNGFDYPWPWPVAVDCRLQMGFGRQTGRDDFQRRPPALVIWSCDCPLYGAPSRTPRILQKN